MKTVKLITCNDAMEAHILQGALENEGIESVLHNENFSTTGNIPANSVIRLLISLFLNFSLRKTTKNDLTKHIYKHNEKE